MTQTIKTTATAKTGAKITLFTDDTLTLAIGPERTESTPRGLANLFSHRTLQAIRSRSKDSSIRAKLEKAIKAIAK